MDTACSTVRAYRPIGMWKDVKDVLLFFVLIRLLKARNDN